METTIEVKGLCKSYAGIAAVEGVSFSVGRGEVFGLLGANGAGKSTVFLDDLTTGLDAKARRDVWTLILAVQITVNMLYAFCSLALVYAIGVIFFDLRLQGSWAAFLGAYLLVMLSMYSLGVMVGGIAPNIKTANLLCSLLYFPMLLFSGATLPYELMPAALQRVADLLPLTQGIKLLKSASLGQPPSDVLAPILVMVALAVVCIGVSICFFRWE